MISRSKCVNEKPQENLAGELYIIHSPYFYIGCVCYLMMSRLKLNR